MRLLSTARCNFDQIRRRSLPGFFTFHSSSPKTLMQVESVTRWAFWYWYNPDNAMGRPSVQKWNQWSLAVFNHQDSLMARSEYRSGLCYRDDTRSNTSTQQKFSLFKNRVLPETELTTKALGWNMFYSTKSILRQILWYSISDISNALIITPHKWRRFQK